MTYNFKKTMEPLCKNCWASNALTRCRHRAKLKMDIFASAAQSTRDRSRTTLTRFWFFLPPTPLRWNFLWYKCWQKSGQFWTTYLPCLVKVVCERPLLPASSTLSTSINRFHLQKWKLGHQGKFEFAFFPLFSTYYILLHFFFIQAASFHT